jgi:phage internal scaffolding protein
MSFKNRFSPSERVVSPKGVEPAQQQFKDDCDINSIMRKFQKTGAIEHVAVHQGQYGIATPFDYHHSLNIVTRAQQMFDDLPSSLRRRFNGKPEELLEFVQNPENADEAAKLGLALSDEAAAKAAEIEWQAPIEPPGAANSEVADVGKDADGGPV